MSDILLVIFCLSVFFFQAEDGIRDSSVTGVQTCALPISGVSSGRNASAPKNAANTSPRKAITLGSPRPARSVPAGKSFQRSEERRVGKEGRSRWSPDH